MRTALLFLATAALASAQFAPDSLVRTILDEFSTENAMEHTRVIASYHRLPVSRGFEESARYVMDRAGVYGLKKIRLETFGAGHPMWDPVGGELEILEPEKMRIASVRDTPLAAMTRSRGGEVTAELIDAGQGSELRDYQGLDVKGKIVLTRAVPPNSVWREMARRGAVALVCAESLEYFGRPTPRDSISWLEAPENALAMAISPDRADLLAGWLREGKTVRLHMRLETMESKPGELMQITGEIPGTQQGRDIVVVAHLDHPKPSANDNASGSAVLLECVRTLNALVESGRIPKPKRTIRFWWSTEIRSERMYFKRYPEESKKILLAINLDQAGGDRLAETNFIVIYGPDRLPSFADDLIHGIVEEVAERYAPAEHEPSPLVVAKGGSARSFHRAYWPYMELSDHISFEAPDVGIPAISLAVPSLDVIHTDLDLPERVDPTWLKRSGLITLTSAIYSAGAGPEEATEILEYSFRRAVARLAAATDQDRQLEVEKKRLESVRAIAENLSVDSYVQRLMSVAAAMKEKAGTRKH